MIYLDNAATTMVDRSVSNTILDCMNNHYGNPGSKYGIGIDSKNIIYESKKKIAELIGCDYDQIIFTSSGTEANNIVFRCTEKYLKHIDKTTIAISSIEHESVLKASESIVEDGFVRKLIRPLEDGSVNNAIEQIEKMNNVGLVSVMMMNNETGVSTDVKKIAEYCNKSGILFHTDCVQAAGCCKINAKEIGCDFLTISSHKIHGPKGIAMLYVKDKSILSPFVFGGLEQEYGIVSGTQNVPYISGFAKAMELTYENFIDYLTPMRDDIASMIFKKCNKYTHVHFNGCPFDNPGKTISVMFDGIDAETLVMILGARGVCVSTGSACRSLIQEPSYVLTEMGIDDEDARNSIRISVSKFTTHNEIEEATDIIADTISKML